GIVSVLILVLVSGCQSSKTGKESALSQNETKGDIQGQITISGAYALFPLILRMSEDFMALHPLVKVEVTRMGTGEGITELLTKKTQLAMISRPLTEEEINEGIWVIPVAKDGVAPIVNQKNPHIGTLISQGLSPEEFMKLFTTEKHMTWGDVLGSNIKDKIVVYTRADESGAAVVWADFLYKKPSELRGIGVTGDEEMIKSIQENPLGIGYCNFSYAFNPETGERIENIQIVPADLDFDNKIERKEMPFSNLEEAHRSLWLGFYPDDLCRELTIGSLGKPTDPLVIEFLYFVLGEGQAGVKKSGFCPLNNVYLNYALESLQ
ncbi:MAG: substrate-binding domain-containing protein, partial [Bacteroidales bacterium]